ncbi:hypothetical protein BD410DRAFT_830992 [Rickenella mellea]|uniref:Uncharacterized protein n=1 Tax=Rickenella mellea TaxID=50990 RepID=A0A4Y7PTH7_9AGAM|nr:hypothetical protein BD410DRAFT_830992 [Rickenella mellea]
MNGRRCQTGQQTSTARAFVTLAQSDSHFLLARTLILIYGALYTAGTSTPQTVTAAAQPSLRAEGTRTVGGVVGDPAAQTKTKGKMTKNQLNAMDSGYVAAEAEHAEEVVLGRAVLKETLGCSEAGRMAPSVGIDTHREACLRGGYPPTSGGRCRIFSASDFPSSVTNTASGGSPSSNLTTSIPAMHARTMSLDTNVSGTSMSARIACTLLRSLSAGGRSEATAGETWRGGANHASVTRVQTQNSAWMLGALTPSDAFFFGADVLAGVGLRVGTLTGDGTNTRKCGGRGAEGSKSGRALTPWRKRSASIPSGAGAVPETYHDREYYIGSLTGGGAVMQKSRNGTQKPAIHQANSRTGGGSGVNINFKSATVSWII